MRRTSRRNSHAGWPSAWRTRAGPAGRSELTRRRLDTELVRRKLVASRTEARRAIDAGLVRVGGATSPKASTLVAEDDPVHLLGQPERFVSRAGRKLDGALESFAIDVAGCSALDVGASTGGFTHCLLERGAAHVTALDVGYGQLHWTLRTDPRVTVVERTNFRTADPALLGGPFDLIVADLSFISLTAVLAAMVASGGPGAQWILLVKPQFEAGKGIVDRTGVVTDPGIWRDVLERVLDAYESAGLGCQGLTVSSVPGATGNVEFVAWFARGGRRIAPEDIDAVVTAAHQNTDEPPTEGGSGATG